MGTIRLTKDDQRALIIPAGAVTGIIGVTNDRPEGRLTANTLVHYDIGGGAVGAWVLAKPAEVLAMVMEKEPQPRPWMALTSAKGDLVALLADAVVSMEGVDPATAQGAQSLVHFREAGGERVKFLWTSTGVDEIEQLQAEALAPFVGGDQPARASAPTAKPKKPTAPRRRH